MRIVVAVDWSDQAFNAVQEVCKLYTPTDLTLVHAVDLGVLERPVVAQAMNVQGYDEFRQGMMDAGKQLLDQTAALIPPTVKNVHRVCEIGSPARIVLDAVTAASTDLVVLGCRGRGRLAEHTLGSVSHRVLTHTPCSTLLVKRPIQSFQKAVVAVEGPEDASRLREWLHGHPFNKKPVDLSVINVVPIPYYGDTAVIPSLDLWNESTMNYARNLVRDMAKSLDGTKYRATHKALQGHPPGVIGQEAAKADLLIVGAHSRKGLERFLLGSVSHALSHRAACSVLVVR